MKHDGHDRHDEVRSGPPRRLDRRTEAAALCAMDAAFKVHPALGPGLLESVYEHCMAFEIFEQGVKVQRQSPLPVVYRDQKLDAGFRLDLIVDDRVVVEIKAVDRLAVIHEAQLLTYLKLSGMRLGFLVNFNTVLLKDGFKRMIL